MDGNDEHTGGGDFLDSVLGTLEDCVWSYSLVTHRPTYVSPAVEAMTGRPPEAYIDTPAMWLEAVHPEDREQFNEAMLHRFKQGSETFTYRCVLPDGSIRWIESRAWAVCDDDGTPLRVDGISTDMTARREAERQLRTSEAEKAAILDALPDIVLRMSAEGRYLDFHARPGDLLLSPDSFLGRRIEEVMDPESAKMTRSALERVLETGDVQVVEGGYPAPDGTMHSLEARYAACGDEVISVVRDVTERKRLERELLTTHAEALEASRTKSEFMANMSHEIRTPMNAVIGMAGLLLTTDLTSEQRDYAETVQSAARSLLKIINDILDISKIEAGRLDIERSEFDVERVVADTVRPFREEAGTRGLQLDTAVSSQIPSPLRGDPWRLRQVITNLVANALKFTEEGMITVGARLAEQGDGRVVHFHVSDTGIGIAAGDAERLFEAFTQADGSATRRHGGTGLGLAISRQLVELMGGEIGVRSTLGRGSTFWFVVPFERSVARATA